MGPTNIALVKLFQADKALRDAQEKLDSASRSVRVQQRKINDLNERLTLAQSQLKEQQGRAMELEGDVRARDEKIERLRKQQQESQNLKEYQAFLTEINTEKIDKNKAEEEALKLMEAVEKLQTQIQEYKAQLEGEQARLDELNQQLSGRLGELQAEVDALKPLREEAAAASGKARMLFERLSERYAGEAMAPIQKPNPRREEYVCSFCNMSLVTDIYNRLHSRDDVVQCPNCNRMLYIPDDLPPELALNTRPKKEAKAKAAAEQGE